MNVIIADQKAQIRSALRLLLEQETSFAILGEGACLDDLIALCDACVPDLLLLDLALIEPETRTVVAELRHAYPTMMIIGLGRSHEDAAVVFDLGIDAFISKTDAPQQVLNRILSVASLRQS